MNKVLPSSNIQGFAMIPILKRVLVAMLVLLALPLASMSVSAYHYEYDDRDYQQPIYRTGHYYNTVAYGYSGWDYHRIHYSYHYPYSTNYGGYGYSGYGGSYGYSNSLPYGWTRWQYAYPVNPGYVGYPTPGYYW